MSNCIKSPDKEHDYEPSINAELQRVQYLCKYCNKDLFSETKFTKEMIYNFFGKNMKVKRISFG